MLLIADATLSIHPESREIRSVRNTAPPDLAQTKALIPESVPKAVPTICPNAFTAAARVSNAAAGESTSRDPVFLIQMKLARCSPVLFSQPTTSPDALIP